MSFSTLKDIIQSKIKSEFISIPTKSSFEHTEGTQAFGQSESTCALGGRFKGTRRVLGHLRH